MRPLSLSIVALSVLLCAACERETVMKSPEISDVRIEDSFWSAKMRQWSSTTVDYLFDKFEGKDVPRGIASEWAYCDAFRNFDNVSDGLRDTGEHAGFPWYDGLIYETIRAAADFLQQYPDPEREGRINSYIRRIAAAQEENGYINTYTQLVENSHRWGENGGKLRWQHDLYNSGALVDAAVHYYNATGNRDFLRVACRLADLICDYIGWAPKHDIVPGHALPEEAFVSLYELTGRRRYLDQVRFWIDARGSNHPGLDNAYAQDRIPVKELSSLEGHAVRASLLMDGIAAYTRVSEDSTYLSTCRRLWDNMAGRKMLLTGSIGSISEDEKFGEDFFIPVDAYAETCAGVGLAFYSYQMHLLDVHGKYMDEFERALYNNVLGGIGFSGTDFTYVNPLNAEGVSRWKWHSCPCCPPMFLKLMSELPAMIYSVRGDEIFVNLYIGNEAKLSSNLTVKMSDGYSRGDAVTVELDLKGKSTFPLYFRIPGWALSKENPFDLYVSSVQSEMEVTVNGDVIPLETVDGYLRIEREWSRGDQVRLSFPMEPRYITADSRTGMDGLKALALGPYVYCLEKMDNPELDNMSIGGELSYEYCPDLLGGVNLIKGDGFTAVPSFCFGNRTPRTSYKIWVPAR